MRNLIFLCFSITLTLLLVACNKEKHSKIPTPTILTYEAIGYYCNMTIIDHYGPKGQIHLNKQSETIWFASVRDTIAFTLLPEESKDIAVIYVSDMSSINSWNAINNIEWIDAKNAFYVIGSSKFGGMDTPETIPFSAEENAKNFIREYGGKIVNFSDIPKRYVLGIVRDDN